jgi:uncharacterized membrane protein YsdA (DUF1294 family)
MSIVLLIVICVYAAMSLTTLLAYGWDKRQAAMGRWRISERTLHLLELLGGWPGAVVGRTLFHHKRRKLGFSAITAAIALLHIGLWSVAYWTHTQSLW